MNDEYVWEDINRKQYRLQDIDDVHLSNILLFISKGGGRVSFLTEDKIKKLYAEAEGRKLTIDVSVNDLISAFNYKVSCIGDLIGCYDWDGY